MIMLVDASVAAKWFFNEPHAENALALLADEYELHAPDIINIELCNVLCKRIRRRDMDVAAAAAAKAEFQQLPVETHDSQKLLPVAYDIAVLTGQSVYDALYLALAVEMNCSVVTGDRKMYEYGARSELASSIIWIGDVAV
jgi:predicted nucleic acid-binding protein